MARTARSDSGSTVTADLEVENRDLLVELCGPAGEHLEAIQREYGISAGVRGNTLMLRGAADDVAAAQRSITQVLEQMARGTVRGSPPDRPRDQAFTTTRRSGSPTT
ncbi:MAG: hypothetical protein R3B82_08685 [Sandaracinaceae bacterium]